MLLAWTMLTLALPGIEERTASLEVVHGDPAMRVVIRQGDAELRSPEEGLWSIAMDWEGDWPADWRHAHPESLEQSGDWTILRGRMVTGSGEWQLTDAYRLERGLIRCTRRFHWAGEVPIARATLAVRFRLDGAGPGVVMPGILYHGNPSGARSGRTPVYTGEAGEEALFEEHRFAMPFVSVEWRDGLEGPFHGAAMHTVPCPAPYAHRRDQWWSLGLVARDGATELTAWSGPCASNGQRGVIKAVQPGFVPYPETWLSVPPGAIIEKTFYLDAYPVAREGSGFQRATRASLTLYPPALTGDLPTPREIIEGKLRYAETRWFESGEVAGYRKYPDRPPLVMGWCGQAEALGYAFQVLARHVDIPQAGERVQRSLDFLATAAFYDGGFHTWYHPDRGEWAGHEPLSQGQAMLCFANAVRLGREADFDTSRWESFLRRACDFHARRILDPAWTPHSTDQAFFIAPLCEGAALFDEPTWRDAAVKAGETYAARSLTMREPYWGGTLDASCEDKEGAFAALQGFLALHDATGEERYLEWAEHALDVVLTYVVVWDIDLPAGRLRSHGFKTRGWTAVSPQNQHIDVFGVLIAPLVYRMGQLRGEPVLQDLALLMFRSCGQLMDAYGSQGEQPQHTNYAQRGRVDDVDALRGGYVEDWTVFWITAHFLNAAAQFIELDAFALDR
jgi:hypothetical protein